MMMVMMIMEYQLNFKYNVQTQTVPHYENGIGPNESWAFPNAFFTEKFTEEQKEPVEANKMHF